MIKDYRERFTYIELPGLAQIVQCADVEGQNTIVSMKHNLKRI